VADPAAEAKGIFWVTLCLTGVAFLPTHILLFYFVFRFQSQKSTAHSASFIRGNNKLELIWTIVPTICFLGLAVWSQFLWLKSLDAADPALVIEVVGEQFNWRVRYAGPDNVLGRTSFRSIAQDNPLGIERNDSSSWDDFIPVQMHVPKGQKVKLILRSNDVIHSFYIPMFRTKMDAVPGMLTTMQFTARYTTDEMRGFRNNPSFNYEIACAELCGRLHFVMKLILVVDEPEEFNNWYARQKPWTEDQPAATIIE
jgi:cytochrome c oxidase subunit 2